MNAEVQPLGKGMWRVGYAQRDLPIYTIEGGRKGTVPAGRLFRIYLGQLVASDPSTQSPTAQGRYAIEVAPPPDGFWASYPSDLFKQILAEQAAAFAADDAARQKRAGWTDLAFNPDQEFDPRGGSKITGDELNANPKQPLVTPDLTVPAAAQAGFPWWLLLVGIGAGLLLTRKPGRSAPAQVNPR